ncbi:hypothetical protein GF337_06265 [candidate division KSB1 bacterium]|nr:hypothetical protein [candidate division KSB1 bacterium]
MFIQFKKFLFHPLFQVLFLTFFSFSSLANYPSDTGTILANRINSSIVLDGSLDEDIWSIVGKTDRFIQRELHEGESATERTEVAILYDSQNLYIGIWCYDSEPDELIANEFRRDFGYGDEDNFLIIIDTFHDHRNGYFFAINPNGARTDALVSDEGKGYNRNWNGVWDVATSMTDAGWFAEVEIPFATLKFQSTAEQTWGINFERNIQHKREQILWQGWQRHYNLQMLSQAGNLVGLRDIRAGNDIEFKPYTSIGAERERGTSNKRVSKVGGDLNYLFTPTLKLNVTLNTDFSQVESDRARINLSRFSLFFPEQRQFFLEGAETFRFEMGSRNEIFYSRRIGIKGREEIPIIGGVRLIGKSGAYNVGAFTLQTAEKNEEPTTNYSVVRLKRDVLSQSNIGVLFTNKSSSSGRNTVYGFDANYITSKFLGNRNLEFGGSFAQSNTENGINYRNNAYRLYMRYPDDLMTYDMSISTVQKNFDPQVGFTRRNNVKWIFWRLFILPRPNIPGIKMLVFKPFHVDYYLTDDTNEPESALFRWRPFGFHTNSGEFFVIKIFRYFERLDEDFNIHDGNIIQAGEYWFTQGEMELSTFGGRKLSGRIVTNWGEFFDGQRFQFSGNSRLNISNRFNIQISYDQNHIDLPLTDFVTREIGGRMSYYFSTKMYSSFFAQWNNDQKEAILNFRINWIPQIGSDFYFVINQTISTASSKLHVQDTTVLSKLVWRFAY